MYTIKINVKKDIGAGSEILDTFYFEASNISTKIYSRDEKTSMDELITKVKESVQGFEYLDDILFHKPNDKGWNILHISYFNDKGEYKNMFVFSNAIVYIMQNGKTVDSIYV